MKNKAYFGLAISCLMFLSACSNDDNHRIITPKFDIVRSEGIDLSAEGGTTTIEFTSESGVSVEAGVDAKWCRIEEVADGTVTVLVDPNEDIASRSAVVNLTDGETSRKVAILQTGAIWIYDRDETTIYVNEAGGDVMVNMSSSFPFKLSVPGSASDWLSGTVTDDGFKLKVQKNTTGNRRTASLTVKMNGRTAEYTVVQFVVDDLLGAWDGEILSDIKPVAAKLTGAKISKTGEGNYQISLPLADLSELLGEDTSLELTATYLNGKFAITSPQKQNISLGEGMFGSIIIASPEGLALNGNIYLSSEVRKGVITYTYSSTGYFCLGFFDSETPSQNGYTGNAIGFSKLSLQKSLK